jgi:hypothetical protein
VSAQPNDNDVGYSKPPKHSRWKKGQCGNPKRQYRQIPKGTVQIIDALLFEKINIVESGISRRVTVFEAILLHLLSKEISGDKRAMAARLKYQEFVVSQAPREPTEIIIIQGDKGQNNE